MMTQAINPSTWRRSLSGSALSLPYFGDMTRAEAEKLIETTIYSGYVNGVRKICVPEAVTMAEEYVYDKDGKPRRPLRTAGRSTWRGPVIRVVRHLNWWVRFTMRPHYTNPRGE